MAPSVASQTLGAVTGKVGDKKGLIDVAVLIAGRQYTAHSVEDFDALCRKRLASDKPFVVIAKIDASSRRDVKRKHSDGREDKYVFVRHVEKSENIVIMGPSEHN